MGVLMAFDLHSFEFISLAIATVNELYLITHMFFFAQACRRPWTRRLSLMR
jgi:hypothetical protein